MKNDENKYDIYEMEARIRELRSQAELKKTEAHSAIDTQIRMAEAQLELMKAKLKSVGQRTEAATQEIKFGVEDAWKDLKSSVERASQYFN